MYTANDFNINNAPKAMVQYVIDMVEDFDSRYQRALSIIGRDRCPLWMADQSLSMEIQDCIDDWCNDIYDDSSSKPIGIVHDFQSIAIHCAAPFSCEGQGLSHKGQMG